MQVGCLAQCAGAHFPSPTGMNFYHWASQPSQPPSTTRRGWLTTPPRQAVSVEQFCPTRPMPGCASAPPPRLLPLRALAPIQPRSRPTRRALLCSSPRHFHLHGSPSVALCSIATLILCAFSMGPRAQRCPCQLRRAASSWAIALSKRTRCQWWAIQRI